MNSTLAAACIMVVNLVPGNAQIIDAKEGIAFLQKEMNSPEIDKGIFKGRSSTFELRLYAGGPPYAKKDIKMVEIRTEAGESEYYIFDQQKVKLLKIMDFQKSKGGYWLRYNNMDFVFVCSLGAAHVIVS